MVLLGAVFLHRRPETVRVEPRTTLLDCLRDNLGLTGAHTGCEHGVCGACTVEFNGEISRSCITYSAACEGASVRTIEGFDEDALMVRLRAAFTAEHALQCGYCTPGMLIASTALLKSTPNPGEEQIRDSIGGNLCRCTGYRQIVDAVKLAAAKLDAQKK